MDFARRSRVLQASKSSRFFSSSLRSFCKKTPHINNNSFYHFDASNQIKKPVNSAAHLNRLHVALEEAFERLQEVVGRRLDEAALALTQALFGLTALDERAF